MRRTNQLSAAMLASLLLGSVSCGGDELPTEQREPTPILPELRAASGGGQTATIGTQLPLPLQASVVRDGVPQAGISVSWATIRGVISPVQSTTDTAGIASATWTLDTLAGADTAVALVAGARGTPAEFTATALPGPLAAIRKQLGDQQVVEKCSGSFLVLVAMVTDQYGNPRSGEVVRWTIVRGSVEIDPADSATSVGGWSSARLVPTGWFGTAVVRAAVASTSLSVDFTVTVAPPAVGSVVLNPNLHGFVSCANGTKPAVDTVSVGQTVTWTLRPHDLEDHSVTSIGTPTFDGGGDFHFSRTVSATFTSAGTYRYKDRFNPMWTGTVVVR
jgi:plastocyanin